MQKCVVATSCWPAILSMTSNADELMPLLITKADRDLTDGHSILEVETIHAVIEVSMSLHVIITFEKAMCFADVFKEHVFQNSSAKHFCHFDSPKLGERFIDTKFGSFCCATWTTASTAASPINVIKS